MTNKKEMLTEFELKTILARAQQQKRKLTS